MLRNRNMSRKKSYSTPEVVEIRLDNEISLQLSSPLTDSNLEKVRQSSYLEEQEQYPSGDPWQHSW